METKKIIIELTQDQVDYLQRLGNEVDSKVFLIDHMFANHAQDTNTALFDSVPFQHYMQEYEKARFEWEQAKLEFQNTYLNDKVKEATGLKDPKYNWQINDYLSLKCEVTLL